ncbi:hypothetical protein QBC34DRAFT_145044 [Podospora aff. communis PSN243]|uniref:Uncharacterized protein n=1 Tax=Podospora aff. communis PSN243 TaxID=3040156 RepID=A0AAV9GFY4_9PEZI|nr:hypothetical protein QBC34DRAFT_145044 [Podospora aff. communis PSN243]
MEPEFIVAIAAAVLGGGAFITACLQALLEYLSSSSNKAKCSIAAIGSANKLVKTSWSWSQWKLKVQYPLLNLDAGPIIASTWIAAQSDDISTERRLRQLLKKDPRRAWRCITADDRLTSWDVADQFAVMVRRDKGSETFVKFKDLDWEDSWAFLRYRLRHPLYPVQRPRASWAQLLLALGNRDVKSLFVRLVDGDTVHSNMDTPLQRIKLRHLGQIAFVLGFREVSLDVANRVFRAYSPIASITTEEVQVIGKVLRFEGDVLQLHSLISRCSFHWIIRARSLIAGQLNFGMYGVNGISMPLTTLSNAISHGQTTSEYDRAEREAIIADMRGFSAGPVLREALLLREILEDNPDMQAEMEAEHVRGAPRVQPVVGRSPSHALVAYTPRETFAKAFLSAWFHDDHEKRSLVSHINIPDCLAQWQGITLSRVPTLYAAASFASIHGVILAFPSRAVLHPILPWVRTRAKAFYRRHMETPLFKVSEEFIQSTVEGRLGFSRESSDYLVAQGVGNDPAGVYGWGCTDLKLHFDLIPQKLQTEIIPQPAKWSASIVLARETLELLKGFEISRWAAEVTEKQKASFNMYKALNLIWCQIIILDIAIQFFIKGQWRFEPSGGPELSSGDPLRTEIWGKQEAAVVQSIVKAWRPSHTAADYIHRKAEASPQQPEGRTECATENHDDVAGNGEAAASPSDATETASRSGNQDSELDTEDETTTTPNISSSAAHTNGEEQRQPLVFQEWQLARHLENNENVFPGARTKSTLRKCKFLADMLELRAIFVVALLCLHPDSSDIYLTENEDIEMPMA